jgi:S-adenosylmethionine:tRNA ribosyltransferase-isomerase
MIKKEDFNFNLPKELIAQTPILNREESKLLVLNRETGDINHKKFKDIIDYLEEGDCLVLNDTKVIPARLIGSRESGGKAELLLLNQKENGYWECLVYPGKKITKGTTINFGDNLLKAHVEEVTKEGNRIVRFEHNGIFEEILDRLGEMPLPPYITEKLEDKDRYQTVYATNKGSAAAPTAGLHFTEDLLKKIEAKKINIAKITLHVGIGTFRPVSVDNVLEHEMHSEWYEVLESQANIINETKKNGKKVIAVGTTSCRTLETLANKDGTISYGTGDTSIFIYPGHEFKAIDGLITNFHLPESTLIMLVSALYNREEILKAYNIAVEKEYRFFSFGDAMLIK